MKKADRPLLLFACQGILTVFDTVAGVVGLFEFKYHFSDEPAKNALANQTDMTMQPYIIVWSFGYVYTGIPIFVDLVISLYLFTKCSCLCYGDDADDNDDDYKAISKPKDLRRLWLKINIVLKCIFVYFMISMVKILLALKTEEAEQLLQTNAAQSASITTFAASICHLILIALPAVRQMQNKCVRKIICDVLCLFFGNFASTTAFLSLLISISSYDVDQNLTWIENLHWHVALPLITFFATLVSVIVAGKMWYCFQTEPKSNKYEEPGKFFEPRSMPMGSHSSVYTISVVNEP